MQSKFRLIAKMAAIFTIIFVIIQPYNWVCKLTQNCKPFYFSYYIPKIEGTTKVKFQFASMNYHKNVEFFPDKDELITVTGRKNLVTYTIKNNSKKFIRVMPKMTFDPPQVAEYIKRYQCLCSKRYLVKAGETITLQMEFELDKKIGIDSLKVDALEVPITIRFKI